jgi:hypothetical protein
MEEADIGMRPERVDISERRVADAGDRTSVVEKLADVGAAAAHSVEPSPHHPAQRIGIVREPGLDPGIAPDRAGESQQIPHRAGSPAHASARLTAPLRAAFVDSIDGLSAIMLTQPRDG